MSFVSVVCYPDALQLYNRYYWYTDAFLSRYEITDTTVDVSNNSIRYLSTATKCSNHGHMCTCKQRSMETRTFTKKVKLWASITPYP